MAESKIKVGIVGATGYTGVELLRLLAQHPSVQVQAVTSRQEVGKKVSDLFANLRGVYDLVFCAPENACLDQCDVVFFATPNGVAMKEAPALLEKGVRVIDLSADYRIKDVSLWSIWYKMTHESANWVEQAVYGLPELYKEQIKTAQLVANPGCYPTAVTLGLLPLLVNGLIDTKQALIADCKSGVSGAGRKGEIGSLLCEAGDNFKAYAVAGHRHLPEIKQTLSVYMKQEDLNFVFVPHLTPMIRGMQANLYVQLTEPISSIETFYRDFYVDHSCVDVLPEGVFPETRSVRGANLCRIGLQKAPESTILVIMSVIDNLVKGASGQAIQNMNVMFGFPENTGLTNVALLP
ncbi:N-acetyl-gamma-glutamyl-phosphate reductase [Neisseria sp. Ec49-e6-T10]